MALHHETDHDGVDMQGWLVESLAVWLAEVQSQAPAREAMRLSPQARTPQARRSADLVHAAQDAEPRRLQATFLAADAAEAPLFDKLLQSASQEHHREVARLRAENAVLRSRLQGVSPQDEHLQRKGSGSSSSSGGSFPRPDSQRFGHGTRLVVHSSDWEPREASSSSSPVPDGLFPSAVAEACERFLVEEGSPPVLGSKEAASDTTATEALQHAAKYRWRVQSLEHEVEHSNAPDILVPTFFQEEKDEVLRSIELLRSRAFSPGNVALEDQLERERDMKHRAGSFMEVFVNDSSLLVPSCFYLWANQTRQMRKPLMFVLRQPWQIHEDHIGDMSNAGQLAGRALAGQHGLPVPEALLAEQQMDMAKKGAHRFILHPGSPQRVTWDLVGAFLLMFDLVMIPLMAFGPERTTFIKVMDWTTLIFWTVDVLMSLITGFVEKGVDVMSPWRILVNYLKTWFLIDLVVIVPDWTFTIMDIFADDDGEGGGTEAGDSGKLLRALRIIRVARLLRLVKLKRIFDFIRDRIESEMMFIMANIVRLIVMLLSVNHFLAAIWYLIGDWRRDMQEENWIQSDQGFNGTSIAYRYTTALHWSLTQFTPASMSVQPRNIFERAFAIAVLVVGLVLFSSFISNITTSMTQLRGMQDDKTKQFWLLRRYLRQHGIQPLLNFRVLRYLEYASREQKAWVSESRVQVLKLLSDQLRDELAYVVSYSCMMLHPLFERTSSHAHAGLTMHRLSSSALSQELLAVSDRLFVAGGKASHMRIVVSGSLTYAKADEGKEHEALVERDDWLCEQTLWTTWVHLGQAKASTECKLVTIKMDPFIEVVRKDLIAWAQAAFYASNYVQWLNTIMRSSLSDVHHNDHTTAKLKSFLEHDPARAAQVKRKCLAQARQSSLSG